MDKMSRKEKNEYLFSMVVQKMNNNGGILKTSDITGLGIDYRRLMKWVEEEKIFRLKSGYYSLAGEEKNEAQLVSGLFPDGILTMDSALFVYGYIDNQPMEWHMAVDKNTSKSRFKMEYPMVRPYYTEDDVMKVGVTTIEYNNASFNIYTKERLLCDCLKFEDKLDRHALQKFLREYIESEDKDIVHLLEYARYRKVSQKVQNRIGVWL